jgi:homocysteine S-methyltransferase
MVQGHNQASAEQLILNTVQIAREAIEEFKKSHPGFPDPLVAASIGPYGAYLADGSEYSGNYGLSDDALTEFHLPRMELLDQSSADFFACETIPSNQESRILAKVLHNTRKQAWVSFSCKDDEHLHDGTTIEEGVKLFASHPGVFAVGINCTAPKFISNLIRRIRNTCGDKKVVVYPNSGEVYHAQSKTWSDSSDLSFFAAMVDEWLDLGVDIIGGCCRLGPQYIKTIVQVVNNRI